MAIALESSGRRFERGGLGLHIPIGVVEIPVSQIARQQDQAVGQRNGLATPTRNPLCGEAMTQIIKTRIWARAIAGNPSPQATKGPIGSAHLQGPAERPDKEVAGQGVMRPANALVALERSHGRWVQRQRALRTAFDSRDTQGACCGIKILGTQPNGLRGANARTCQQGDECAINQGTQFVPPWSQPFRAA